MTAHCIKLLIVVGCAVATSCLGSGKSPNPTERHINGIRQVGYGSTNEIAILTQQVNDKDKAIRLKAVSKLFACAYVAKDRLCADKIGDKIADAYEKEKYGEIKVAMLATLDLLGHPALSNLLVKAGQSDDPEMRNLVILIKEKKYLQPIESCNMSK